MTNKFILQDIIFTKDLNKDVLIINSIFDKSKNQGNIIIHKVCLRFLPSPKNNTKIFEKQFDNLNDLLKTHKQLINKKYIKPKIHLTY